MLITGCAKIELVEKSTTSHSYLLNSDSEIITEVDLSKLNDTELKYALEEIYARHGKIFADVNYKKYFTSKSWYTPDPSFNENSLSSIEKENLQFIYDFINHQSSQNNYTYSDLSNYSDTFYYENRRGDNSYIIPDSSTRRLTLNELAGCSSELLALIRNEIYARNGYIFSKQIYRDYFSSKLWYSPNPNFNESWLSSIEKYNIQLIKSLE